MENRLFRNVKQRYNARYIPNRFFFNRCNHLQSTPMVFLSHVFYVQHVTQHNVLQTLACVVKKIDYAAHLIDCIDRWREKKALSEYSQKGNLIYLLVMELNKHIITI